MQHSGYYPGRGSAALSLALFVPVVGDRVETLSSLSLGIHTEAQGRSPQRAKDDPQRQISAVIDTLQMILVGVASLRSARGYSLPKPFLGVIIRCV